LHGETITEGQKVIFYYSQMGFLYPIDEGIFPTQINSIIGHNIGANIIKWHYCLGHLHIHAMHEMKKRNMIIGIQNNFKHLLHNFPLCEGCVASKQYKIPFSQGNNSQIKTTLQLIHFNICGPMETKSLNGSIYFVMFINDYSQFIVVYFFKKKFDVFSMFQSYKALLKLKQE